MKRWLMVLPLAAFLVVAVFLYRGLYLDPAELPSASRWITARGPCACTSNRSCAGSGSAVC